MDAKKILKKCGDAALTCVVKYSDVIVAGTVGGFIGGFVTGPIREGDDPQEYAYRLGANSAVGTAFAYCVGSTVMGSIHERNLKKKIQKLETELEAAKASDVLTSEEGGDSNEA